MLPRSVEAVYRLESSNLNVELKLKFIFAKMSVCVCLGTFHLPFGSYSAPYIGIVQSVNVWCLSDDVSTVILLLQCLCVRPQKCLLYDFNFKSSNWLNCLCRQFNQLEDPFC